MCTYQDGYLLNACFCLPVSYVMLYSGRIFFQMFENVVVLLVVHVVVAYLFLLCA